jgi:hypothetical protein
VPAVVAAILAMALGMVTFTAPLAAFTMNAVDEADRGLASGFNSVMGQLAGLLAIVVLPAAAGLGGVAFDDPRFAVGYGQALLVITALAAACIPIAAWTLARTRVPMPGTRTESCLR